MSKSIKWQVAEWSTGVIFFTVSTTAMWRSRLLLYVYRGKELEHESGISLQSSSALGNVKSTLHGPIRPHGVRGLTDA